MAGRFTQEDISKLSDRTIFFDANILMYLYWPTSPKSWAVNSYSSIYKQLLSNKNMLALNTFVLSEFINRALRFEWGKNTNKETDFKLFRQSNDGQQTQTDVFDVVKNKILPYFSLTNKILNSAEIKNLLVVDTLDFNDKIILDVCRAHNMVLLTNDADFSKSDVDILSANPKLR